MQIVMMKRRAHKKELTQNCIVFKKRVQRLLFLSSCIFRIFFFLLAEQWVAAGDANPLKMLHLNGL